jgi:LysM repeat protein
MMAVGTPIERSELRPGDLVFFNYGYSHVGIYTGDDKYIHSPSTGKRIQESDLNGKGRGDHFVGARRVIDNRGVTSISDQLKAEWVSQSRSQTALALNDQAAQRHTGANAAYKPAAKSKTAGGKKSSQKTATATVSGSKTHKVVSGDTIVDLAKRYGVSSSDLVASNRLKDKNKLKLGQTLVIPDKKTGPVASANPQNGAQKPKAKTASKPKGKSGPSQAKPKASAQKKS